MMAAFAESGPATGLVGAAERTTRTVRAARWGAAAAAAGTLTLGTAAAAWTGTLPGPWQQAAHQVVGAPAVERVADLPTGPPGGSAPAVSAAGRAIGSEPEIPGSAVPGLCAAHGAGELPVQSQAHRALAEAAGEAGIDDFCAEVERAGSAGDASDRRRDGPAEPQGAAADAPSAAPADPPSGAPPADPPAASATSVTTDPPADPGPAPAADPSAPPTSSTAGAAAAPDPSPTTSSTP